MHQFALWICESIEAFQTKLEAYELCMQMFFESPTGRRLIRFDIS